MKTIWKYKLRIEEFQEIKMPYGAEILTVQIQDGAPHVWAMVDTNEPGDRRHIETVATGDKLSDGPRKYIGTYQLETGLVLHAYEHWPKKS